MAPKTSSAKPTSYPTIHSFSFGEYCAATVVLVVSMAPGLFSFYIWKAHRPGLALFFLGLTIIFLSGVFDPLNALWLLLPFTGRALIKRPYSTEHKIMRRLGFVLALLGLIFWYLGDPWTTHLIHHIQHAFEPISRAVIRVARLVSSHIPKSHRRHFLELL